MSLSCRRAEEISDLQRKTSKEEDSTGMSIFAVRVKSERKARNKKKVQLIEGGKKRGIEGEEDRLIRNGSSLQP